jgi:hypothetical protein
MRPAFAPDQAGRIFSHDSGAPVRGARLLGKVRLPAGSGKGETPRATAMPADAWGQSAGIWQSPVTCAGPYTLDTRTVHRWWTHRFR